MLVMVLAMPPTKASPGGLKKGSKNSYDLQRIFGKLHRFICVAAAFYTC